MVVLHFIGDQVDARIEFPHPVFREDVMRSIVPQAFASYMTQNRNITYDDVICVFQGLSKDEKIIIRSIGEKITEKICDDKQSEVEIHLQITYNNRRFVAPMHGYYLPLYVS